MTTRRRVDADVDAPVASHGRLHCVNRAEERPLLQLLRSDVVLKLYRDGDSYTLRVARLRGTRTTLENLTAEQALTALSKEMNCE